MRKSLAKKLLKNLDNSVQNKEVKEPEEVSVAESVVPSPEVKGVTSSVEEVEIPKEVKNTPVKNTKEPTPRKKRTAQFIVGKNVEMRPTQWKVISRNLFNYFDSQLKDGEYVKLIDGAFNSLPYVSNKHGMKVPDKDTKYTWRACIWKGEEFVRNVYTDKFENG